MKQTLRDKLQWYILNLRQWANYYKRKAKGELG